ncbi:MAG: 7-carboxy-7-deazaguanine synthase QueE [bacterium]|nr:7-carboxy-7-deazaguanine synthase QueE [bacterium]
MDLMTTYPVMEHFYTIQGEGYYTGTAAYFIRLGGCDVGCVWCDVKDSWDASIHPQLTVGNLVNMVLGAKAKLCVITGGEPAMYDLNPLTDALHAEGIQVNIETSGAYPIQGNIDWICLSPKKFKFPIKEALIKADEFKAVVFHPSDIVWAETFVGDLKEDCKLYLQPEWSKSERNTPLIIAYVKDNPQWQISLQTHKFLNIP